MQCEIRKSCNLRNVVYEIGKLTSPVGIVLVDITSIKSTLLFKNPHDKFMDELTTVFSDARRVTEYNLRSTVRKHIETARFNGPIVVEPEIRHLILKRERGILFGHLKQAGVKRIAVVCLTYGFDSLIFANRLAIHLGFCDGATPSNGIDMFAIIDGDEDESQIQMNYGIVV